MSGLELTATEWLDQYGPQYPAPRACVEEHCWAPSAGGAYCDRHARKYGPGLPELDR